MESCILGHHSMLERCCNAAEIPTTRRIDTKERSRRTLPARKMTARSSYGGRYNRLHGNLGREDTCKDGSLEVLVPSRSL